MNYESLSELNLLTFEGKAFACIPVNKSHDRQRVLLVSRSQLIEAIPSSSKQDIVIVKEVHELQGLSSIKFSRGSYGIIMLKFRSGMILQYKVKDAGICSDYVKQAMNNIGINGKVTKSKSDTKKISVAEDLLNRTKELETQFSIEPSFDLIQELGKSITFNFLRF